MKSSITLKRYKTNFWTKIGWKVPWLIFLGNTRSSLPEVFLEKGVPKICSKFTGEHPYQSAIAIKLQCNFIEIALLHGSSPVNLLRVFWRPFSKATSKRLLLDYLKAITIPSHCVDINEYTTWKVSVFGVFCSVFSPIWTEQGDLQSKFPYSDQMRGNVDQKNSKYGHFYAM